MISIAENKDCMAAMAEFPDKFFELAIVDPPYGISINMNMGRKKGRPKKHENKKWDNCTPDKKYFDELTRISKNQIVWGAITLQINFRQVWDGLHGTKKFRTE